MAGLALWATYWVWFAGALLLAILEIFAPGYIFVGFGIGAALVGLMLWPDWVVSGWLTGSLPLTLVVFALLSLLAWVVLRLALGLRKGQTKTWDKDINER